MELLTAMGGYEIAMMAGAFIGAANNGVLLLVDGFIASAAWLVAERICPGLQPFSVFAHCSAEPGHRLFFAHMELARPLLELDLRLGEGSGAALAYPLLESAVHLLNEMAEFGEAGVTNSGV
jgi:nicotinate-nucleotide--dimethylbenzimidazole phosphoribosyltransferase